MPKTFRPSLKLCQNFGISPRHFYKTSDPPESSILSGCLFGTLWRYTILIVDRIVIEATNWLFLHQESINFQSDADGSRYKIYVVNLLKFITLTIRWFRSIMKTQLISSAGDPEVTCLAHKTKVSAFKCWSKENVSVNLRAFYYNSYTNCCWSKVPMISFQCANCSVRKMHYYFNIF